MRPLLFSISLLLVMSCVKKDDPLRDDGANGKALGASARDLLSSSKFKALVVEIDYMTGMRPTDATISNLQGFVASVVNKPSGVRIVLNEIPAQGKSAYALKDINAIETLNRSSFNTGDTIATYILVTDGAYNEPNVLGLAYRNTSMCIFGKTINENTGGLFRPSKDKLESTVAEHEFGHILGLVNVGTPMQKDHQDTQHGGHCTNSSCLMYYQVETTDVVANLMTANIPTLDIDCRADLTANGGK
ncbi:MAG: hypothetical protein V4616_14250 [Bacteroidota bacterium]